MIITRTPFRIPLGGGSTDLPSYYSQFGGFIFGVEVNLYMYIGLNRPPIDDRIRFKYSRSEEVDQLSELQHRIGRATLERIGIRDGIEVVSVADVPEGTGMGSSGSYAVGLMHALRALRRDLIPVKDLAEESCDIIMNTLGLPDGKQDPYLVALGGFQRLDISPDGQVEATRLDLARPVVEDFEYNTLLFYTGLRRSSEEILFDQTQKVVSGNRQTLEAKHRIKDIGIRVLNAFQEGDLTMFGRLMDEHWRVKKSISQKISSDWLDALYNEAKQAGALGGKLMGAGGGGFFIFYCEGLARSRVRQAMQRLGLREVPFRVDVEGTKVITDHMSHRDNHHYSL